VSELILGIGNCLKLYLWQAVANEEEDSMYL